MQIFADACDLVSAEHEQRGAASCLYSFEGEVFLNRNMLDLVVGSAQLGVELRQSRLKRL